MRATPGQQGIQGGKDWWSQNGSDFLTSFQDLSCLCKISSTQQADTSCGPAELENTAFLSQEC